MPGTEAAQRKTELPYASDHFIVSDSFDRACMIFAFKTTSDISVQCTLRPALISIKTLATAITSRTSDPQVSPIDLLNMPCAQCDRIVPMSCVRDSSLS